MNRKINWQLKKLGEIIKLEYGKPLPKSARICKGKYPVYGANGEKDRSNEYYFDKPSIIVGRKGSAGEINLTEGKFWPLDVSYFVTFDDKQYDRKFLYHLLFTLNLPKLAKGVKPGINRNEVYSINVNIPPLPEQKRIVKILDDTFEKLEKAKENAQKNLNNTRELFESYLQNVFESRNGEWKEKSFKELFIIKPSKNEAYKKLNENDLVTFVPMEDLKINEKEFINNKKRKLRDVYSNYTYFSNEDVLLAKITPCFENGKVGIARNLTNEIGFGSSEYLVFRTNNDIIPDFLYYFLFRKAFRNEGESRMTGTVGHKRLSKDFIENYKMPYPESVSEQKSIVIKLDELSSQTKKLESIYKQKIADLEELKKSVLKKAFAGEL